jgi:3'(2'), 5'-bisphosphate nucleotidase
MDIDILCSIARSAGAAIMAIYDGDHAVEYKSDASPLTRADRASHDVIVAGLARNFPDIPVLSEEGRDIPYTVRRQWTRFWLVDPLDGTKEFIKRNGEFTVNIALIDHGRPVLGVVGVPAQDRLYWGAVGKGAWRIAGDAPPCRLATRRTDPQEGLIVVQSRSHPSPELANYLAGIRVAKSVEVGSALKFCIVAEGQADLYPRLGPTMEWDTAAGHAVVDAAGGQVLTPEGAPLHYNKENLLNPYFIVTGSDYNLSGS